MRAVRLQDVLQLQDKPLGVPEVRRNGGEKTGAVGLKCERCGYYIIANNPKAAREDLKKHLEFCEGKL